MNTKDYPFRSILCFLIITYITGTAATAQNGFLKVINDQYYNIINDIDVNKSGEIILTCEGNYSGDYNFIVNADINGNIHWARKYKSDINGTKVLFVNNGFIVGGTRNDSIRILFADSMGNLIWAKAFKGVLVDLALSSSNEIYLLGEYIFPSNDSSSMLLLNMHLNGELGWSKIFGEGSNLASNLHITDENLYFVWYGGLSGSFF